MQLEIRRHNVRMDEAMLDHLNKQMDFALKQFNGWISNVTVHLEDVNGPRQGMDKQCQVLVHLKTGKLLKVEDLDNDWVTVINRAADRLSHVVGRETERRRDHR